MKILFITHYSELYGANKSMLSLILRLKFTSKYILKIIAPNYGPLIDELEKNGIDYQIINFKNFISQKPKDKKIRTYLRIIKEGILKVYFNTRATIKYGKKLTKDIDLIYSNSSVFIFGYLLSQYYGKKHIWHLREFISKDYNHFPIGGHKVLQLLISKSNHVVAVSNAVAYHFNLKRNYSVVYNGVCAKEKINTLENTLWYSYTHTKPLRFIFVGVLIKEKGIEDTLELFSKIQIKFQATLDIVGNGDENYLQYLKSIIHNLKIEQKVTFIGYQNNILELLKSYHFVFVLSDFEAFGRVTAEALSQGTIVIGKNTGGTKELIKDMMNGIIHFDSPSTLIKIDSLLENRHEALQIVKRGLAETNALYTEEAYSNTIDNIIATTNFDYKNLK